MLVLGCPQQLAVSRHEIGGEKVVNRQTVFSHQPADATAEREPGDSCMTDDSARGGETVRLRLVIDVAPQRPTLDPGPVANGIDAYGPHGREVDHDAVVANGCACDVVASATYRDLQVVVASVTYSRHHIRGADASGDHARTPVNGTVPDSTGDVVLSVVGTDQPAAEAVDLYNARLTDFSSCWCGHCALLVSLDFARGGHAHIGPPANRGGKVKNLDFTTEEGCARLTL